MKRKISLLLAICMLVTLLPFAASAGGTEENSDITLYPFYGGKNVLDTYASLATFNGYYYANLPSNQIRYITYENSGGNVEYYAEKTRLSEKLGASTGFSGGKMNIFFDSDGSYVAFKIKIPKAGKYDADTLMVNATSPIMSIYIVPLSADEAAKTGEDARQYVENIISTGTPCMKDISIPTSSDSGYEHLVCPFTAESAGEYLYILSRSGVDNGVNALLCTLALDASPAVLTEVDIAAEKYIDIIGNSFHTITTLKDNNNGIYSKRDAVLEYESTNSSVLTVDKKTGEVTAVGEGKAKVKVTATTPDGLVVGETEEISIVSKDSLGSIAAKSPDVYLIEQGSAQITLTGKMLTGIDADMSNYISAFESSDDYVASVDENGNITANNAGSASIEVKVKNEEEKDITTHVNVFVYQEKPDVVIDFSKTVTKPNHSTPDITPGYTILTDIGNKVSARIFEYSNPIGKLFQFGTGGKKSVWPNDKNRKSNTFAFSVNIPFESSYSVKVKGGLATSGCIYSMFIDGKHIGDHSFWNGKNGSEERSSDTEKTYNTVKLSAGEHIVEFRARKTNYDIQYGYITKLSFIPCDDVSLSLVNSDISENLDLAVGERISGTAAAVMSDGRSFNFGLADNGTPDSEDTFTASLDSDVAEISAFDAYTLSDSGSTGKSYFSIEGKKAGTAELSIDAKVNGEVASKKINVTVSDDPLASTGFKTAAEELFVGDTTELIPQPMLTSGRIITSESVVTTFETKTPDIATVENGMLSAVSVGTAKILVKSVFNGVEKTKEVDVEVLPESMTEIDVTAGGSKKIRFADMTENDVEVEDYIVPLYVTAKTNQGNEVDLEKAQISAVALTPEYATIDDNLNITPVYADPKLGSTAKFRVTVNLDGRIRTVDAELQVICAKTEATVYTAEKAAAARKNILSDSEEKSEIDRLYYQPAENYINQLDKLYELIPSEGIPRGMCVGSQNDPQLYRCRYCGCDLLNNYGSYSWINDPVKRPWKTQCPDCKRVFPSNDFESFYKLGLNEYGEFDRSRALERHAELFGDKTAPVGSDEYYGYGVEGGYLYNELYTELWKDPESDKYNRDPNPLSNGRYVDGKKWGVDDGFGYVPKDENGNAYIYENGVTERHTYIAEYLHWGLWYGSGVINRAISKCSLAYYYSGDKRYGRAAAILIDRLADFYIDYDIYPYRNIVWNSHGGDGRGKTIGCIWETYTASTYVKAYDMVYDMYDDEYVLNYLKNKSRTLEFRHAKNTPNQIRTNIEDGLIREALDSLVDCSISGNFGYAQEVNVHAALILDSDPETEDWIEYLMAPGWSRMAPCLGGGILENLVGSIDGDGMGNEASLYNSYWLDEIIKTNKALAESEKYKHYNLYNNPRFTQMFYALANMIATNYTPNIGDSWGTQAASNWVNKSQMIEAWKNIKDSEGNPDPLFAQVLYYLNGNSAEGLAYDISDPDCKRLEREVRAVINEHGPLNLSSNVMPNFGFAILRGGSDYSSNVNSGSAKDTRHNTWMYFGSNYGHGHHDTLNLGMSAFGLNYMPDLGYPETTGSQPNRLQWVSTTLSHNTVLINENQQALNSEIRGELLHFDSDGAVELIDVSAPYVYNTYDKNAAKCDDDLVDAEEYRRSVLKIEINDDVAYTVDFFRVIGGESHMYSFHAASNTIKSTSGLELVAQTDENGNYVGTLAGKDVPLGKDPNTQDTSYYYKTKYPRGYTWLDNVDRDAAPENKFEIDFAIKDFNKSIRDSSGLGLHMTVLNGGNVESGATADVAIANGYPPKKAENKNINCFKYVLLKNSGSNLKTTFTTVFEPYKNNRLLVGADELDVAVVDGTPKNEDAYRAVRVEHVSGRVDYIFYSTNNALTLEVITDDGNPLRFRGFAGVYTVSKGSNTYKYLHDGDILGEETAQKSSISAVVKSFTTALSAENEIIIAPKTSLSDDEITALAGKCIIVDNEADKRSGAFRILSAERRGENIALDIGKTSTIRDYVDAYDESKGYTHNIAEGQTARIPLTYAPENVPVFEPFSDTSVSAGRTIRVKATATSPIPDETIKYSLSTSPSGAAINADTGEITWHPGDNQVGKNHFAVTATDESGRESTLHFTVTVYGATTPSGGGGAGGGGTPTPTPEPEPTPTPEPEPTPDPTQGEGDGGFIDIDNYAWAKDSINALAKDGVIKGTSKDTFSPGDNITRADFAILLVRAFKLTGEGKENFADVDASDYFAHELAIAKENGIVGGIGDNKYAPRSTITREDMMVIVYRALTALGMIDKTNAERNDTQVVPYKDFDSVADYAKDAVSYLIANGLVNGKNGYIDPKAYTTRAEVAVLLYRILDYAAK